MIAAQKVLTQPMKLMRAHLQCGFGHFLTGTEQCHLQNSGRFKIKTQRYFVSQSIVSRGDWLLLSPNGDQHQFSPKNIYPYIIKRKGYEN